MSNPEGKQPDIPEEWDSCKTIKDVHCMMMGNILAGYLLGEKNLIKWRIAFNKHFPLPDEIVCSPAENCSFLESKGLLGVRNYKLLKDILRFVNVDAVKCVEKAEEKIDQLSTSTTTGQPFKKYIGKEVNVYFLEPEKRKQMLELLNQSSKNDGDIINYSSSEEDNEKMSDFDERKKDEEKCEKKTEKNRSKEMLENTLQQSIRDAFEKCQSFDLDEDIVIVIPRKRKE